jgi:hypothetical protein
MKVPSQSFGILLQLHKHHFWQVKSIEMKGKMAVQLTLALTFICLRAGAQLSEISTDRPDQSNTPLLVPKGALQIESGFTVENEKTFLSTHRNYTYNNTLIKFGINEHFEIRLNTLYQGVSESSDLPIVRGIGPVSIGLKIKMADEHGIWPQASIISHLTLPSGTTSFKPSYTSSDITLACSHGLSERWVITYNGGVKWDGETPAATALYALSLAFDVTDKFSVFAECYGFVPGKSKSNHNMDAGITYKIKPLLQWDLSAGLGLSDDAPDNFLSTGLSIRLFN